MIAAAAVSRYGNHTTVNMLLQFFCLLAYHHRPRVSCVSMQSHRRVPPGVQSA